MTIVWNEEKDKIVLQERGISFEMVLQKRDLRLGCVYVVPYVQDQTKIFLKTIYPSRIATKKYLAKDK